MLFKTKVLKFVLNKMICTYALLIVGVLSLSLFANSAYAQVAVGGMPVPIDSSELVVSLIASNLVWIAPVAALSVIVLKIRSNRK